MPVIPIHSRDQKKPPLWYTITERMQSPCMCFRRQLAQSLSSSSSRLAVEAGSPPPSARCGEPERRWHRRAQSLFRTRRTERCTTRWLPAAPLSNSALNRANSACTVRSTDRILRTLYSALVVTLAMLLRLINCRFIITIIIILYSIHDSVSECSLTAASAQRSHLSSQLASAVFRSQHWFYATLSWQIPQ